MATLPWTPAAGKESPAGDVLVFGSRLELRSYRTVAGFLRAALRLRREVHRSPGALGVSLVAEPARKTFWTLSAWTDQDALEGFVHTPVHQDVMHRFHDHLAGTGFVSWTVDAAALPKPHSSAKDLWRDARERLAVDTTVTSREGGS